MVAYPLEVGLRKSGLVGLLWSQVDLVGQKVWIHADLS